MTQGASSMVLALALAALGAGCGGAGASTAAVVELPPADPIAVRELVAGARLMDRPAARARAQATAHFERALEIDENLWEAHYNLGVMARRERRFERAVERFEAARRIAPAAEEPALALAEARYATGQREQAATVLRTLLERGYGSPDARVALATIYREAGRHDRALEQAREVLVRDPSHVRALIEVGRVYLARGQHEVALLVYRKALALVAADDARTRALLLNEQGLLELDRGDTQAAFQAFGEATQADARFTPAHRNQGAVLLRAGDYRAAAAEYEAVLATDADDHDARVALGAALRGQGEHRRAKREYERVLAADPDHLGALFNLAVLRAEFLNERPGARVMFQRFLELAPPRHEKRALAERFVQEIGPPASAGPGGDAK